MSDDQSSDRQKLRELRGAILWALNSEYGKTVDFITFKSLKKIVVLAESLRALETEMKYLVDCGYAEKAVMKRDALDANPIIGYRLISKGKRLLNGDDADNSIEL